MSLTFLCLRKKTIAIANEIRYTLSLSELTGKEDRKGLMPRAGRVEFENSIASALGALYQRKERGTTLIRVLEDYRRFKESQKPGPRLARVSTNCDRMGPHRELARLRMRRAAVEQVIRSIEEYSATQMSA